MKYLHAIVLLLAVSAISCGRAAAQPRSIGGIFSFSELDISYQHQSTDSTFFEINAGIDLCEVLDAQTSTPGVRASFSYNFIFWTHNYESGKMSAYGGVGFTAGYVMQTSSSFGPMAGLLGKIGLKYEFKVPVTLSVDITPVLGMHMEGKGSDSSLLLYLDGLSRCYYPRIGIRYNF